MNKLTSHERLTRIFRGEEIDRPALKLWGASPDVGWQLHEAYGPVSALAAEMTDLFAGAGGYGLNPMFGSDGGTKVDHWKTETGDPLWLHCHTRIHTPKGDVEMVRRGSQIREPGYDMEHYVKDEEDIEKLLSIPYTSPEGMKKESYDEAAAHVGNRGIAMIDLPHAAYFVHQMMGSETLAYLSVDARELVDELISVYAKRIYDHVKRILETGVEHPIFGWCGPELFLPPLLSPRDFDDFVGKYDKPICDLIHEHGGYVWVHSHGQVRHFIERFIEMGVDVINPLEPEWMSNGDVDLDEVVGTFGGRIGLEGNIEIQEILQSSKERIAGLIDACVEAGWKSGRLILCPSAGYMEYPRPTEQYIENLLFYLRYGYEAVEKCRK